MYAGEALAQAKFELRGMYFKYLSLLILPELIPPYPEECMLTANENVLVVVIITPFFLP